MENKENRFTENAELSDDELDSVSGGVDDAPIKFNNVVALPKFNVKVGDSSTSTPQYVAVDLTSAQQRVKERLKKQR